MAIDYRTCRADEIGDFLKAVETAFFFDAREEDAQRVARVIDHNRLFVACDDDLIVGGGGTFTFSLTVPGGELPAGGITMVGVLPSHRRRGILTEIMRMQLEDCRARGEPLAVLLASEGPIYQRFGFGLASYWCHLDIERDRARFKNDPGPVGRTRLVDRDEALKILPEVYDRVRAASPGMFRRSSEWWDAHRLRDDPEDRKGSSKLYMAVWEHEGRAEAYALYRSQPEWEDGMPTGRLEVKEVIAPSPPATREIWRFLFGVDLIARIRAISEPVDCPLLYMLTEPRRLRFRLTDGLWLRVVDLPAALRGRSYAQEGVVTLEVGDGFCPWNEGLWRLEVGSGEVVCERSDGPADLRLSAEELGAIYLGGTTFAELGRGGRVEELAGGARARADAMFATERAPTCPEMF